MNWQAQRRHALTHYFGELTTMGGFRRFGAMGLLALAMSSTATAQTMRFETTAGNFDMQLNPTNDANLQPLVDNMVAYIGLGRYHYTAINRAPEGFVLQMGSFLGFPPTPNDFLGLLQEIRRLDPVVVDANNDGQVDFASQSNTRGTVSLALSANPNTGTSSFFINIGDNSGLDSQGFVPFARIVDMTVVDRIMGLEKVNLTGDPNDLTFNNVPLTENGRIVVLKSVHVLQAAPGFSFVGPVEKALQQIQAAESQSASANLAAMSAAALSASEADDGDALATPVVVEDAPPAIPPGSAAPEPGTLALCLAPLLAARRLRRRCR